ncbi:MAG: FAD-binding and (Fe-S)-binding domain-containing protein [Actinomycetaceae bacterium]|nr:FAD-binding and (Fe-S)-binding domain-containing protein [Actinomycetaceae bacterium]
MSKQAGVPGTVSEAGETFPSLYRANPDRNVPDDELMVELAWKLRGRVRGELDFTALARGIYSTDAGNYRVVPQAVFAPVDKNDALVALGACRELGIPVTARGAGTSCGGNAIGSGLVMDFQRHMNRVVSIDPHTQTAVVEPGCIEATLQAAAAEYDLRFGPDPSTQNRCTIGGMVGNNACGPHALAWGKTADNVLALEVVDGVGRHYLATATGAQPVGPEPQTTTGAQPVGPEPQTATSAQEPQTATGTQEPQTTTGQSQSGSVSAEDGSAPLAQLTALVDANLEAIRTQMGRFSRQVSGYSLEYMLPENHRNFASFLVGTEGTLTTTLEITVRLVPIPTAPVLVAIGYPDMVAAGYDVPALLPHHPLAVEGMDSRLVDVVRAHHGPGAVPELPAGQGWLMCEIGGSDLDDAMERARAMAADANSKSIAIYPPGEDAARLWRIRADGAGLGGRTPVQLDEDGNEVGGNEQAWPGWEDAAVPPQNLGDYLRDFSALMVEHGIDGLLYGHFGDGCVHVRLDMPLGSAAGVGKSKEFLVASAKLLGKYGGSMSGEHGDGRSRSELLQYMYSTQILQLFAEVKAIFDPENLMNPGVLTKPAPRRGQPDEEGWGFAPDPLEANLRRPAARAVLAEEGFQFTEDHGDFTTAVHRCTGVSKCRADLSSAGGFMCPSFQATGEEVDSTRGRARILEELTNGGLISSWDDPRVARALDLCLACKACAADCPAGIDMAKYRSESFYRRYRGRMRPLSHYLLGWLPRWTNISASIPGAAAVANQVMRVGPIRKLAFKVAGIDSRRQMPALQGHRFTSRAARRGLLKRAPQVTQLHLGSEQSHNHPQYVVVFTDSFSNTLNDQGVFDLVQVLVAAGYTPLLPPEDVCCGLTWITTGQLPAARKRLTHLVEVLGPFAAAGIPIVGVEPSCTAVLRDDLKDLGVKHPQVEAVVSATMTLAELLTAEAPRGPRGREWLPNLDGVEVVAQPHCHHYSVMGWSADRKLLQEAGATVTELSGCCGLAGNFGMEKGHYDTSVAVAERSLLPALERHPHAVYLADGFSCRTQAQQLAGRDGVHLATLLRQVPAGACSVQQ